jgi:hypothetical protein
MNPTARVLQSAARWLQRRAKKRTADDTKAAYREAISLLNRLVQQRKEKSNARPAARSADRRVSPAADAK